MSYIKCQGRAGIFVIPEIANIRAFLFADDVSTFGDAVGNLQLKLSAI